MTTLRTAFRPIAADRTPRFAEIETADALVEQVRPGQPLTDDEARAITRQVAADRSRAPGEVLASVMAAHLGIGVDVANYDEAVEATRSDGPAVLHRPRTLTRSTK